MARTVLGVVLMSLATLAGVALIYGCAGHRDPAPLAACRVAPGGVVEVEVTFEAEADRASYLALVSCPVSWTETPMDEH